MPIFPISLLRIALLAGALQSAKPAPAVEDPGVTALALRIYAQMRSGHIDPSLMTPEMSAQFPPETLADEKPIFDQLGDPVHITWQSSERHTKGTLYAYLVAFRTAQFHVQLFVHPDGKFAGYGLAP